MNMKTQFNEETHKYEWVINKWYNKVIYVVGCIYVGIFAIGFAAGFLLAIME